MANALVPNQELTQKGKIMITDCIFAKLVHVQLNLTKCIPRGKKTVNNSATDQRPKFPTSKQSLSMGKPLPIQIVMKFLISKIFWILEASP